MNKLDLFYPVTNSAEKKPSKSKFEYMNNATEANNISSFLIPIFHHLIAPCSGHGTLGSDGNCICHDYFKGTDCSGKFTITIFLFGHTTYIGTVLSYSLALVHLIPSLLAGMSRN